MRLDQIELTCIKPVSVSACGCRTYNFSMRGHRLLIILRHHLAQYVYSIVANFLLGYIMTFVVVIDTDHGGVAFAFTTARERVWHAATLLSGTSLPVDGR
mgnify:CR=1 FL=1